MRAYLCAVSLLIALLIGLPAGLFATCFPGMLNMTAVATSLRAGRRKGIHFAAGLSAMFCLQVAVAMGFADYLAEHPAILRTLEGYATYVFALLAVFFAVKGWRARRTRLATDANYKGSAFLRGMGMALMNLLTIPFFFALGGYLIAEGYLDESLPARLFFALGAGAGALLNFNLYARSARWIESNVAVVSRNINFFLAGLFLVLAVLA